MRTINCTIPTSAIGSTSILLSLISGSFLILTTTGLVT